MRRRGLRLAWSWLLGATAVGAVAWSLAGENRSLGLALAVVGTIILVLAYDLYSEAMSQGRADGLATTRAHRARLFWICIGISTMIIGFPVNLLMRWNLHNIHAMALEAVRSFEHGGNASVDLIYQGVTTNSILGTLAVVSLMTLWWRAFVRPDEMWRAAAPSVVRKQRMNSSEP